MLVYIGLKFVTDNVVDASITDTRRDSTATLRYIHIAATELNY